MKEIIQLLLEKKRTIATMESCTGGGVANAITNVEGASEVFHFAAVTYSNEYKIKMGVSKEVIDTYTVYSQETADAMAKAISDFSNSDYGIGITGKLNRTDPSNLSGNDNIVYFSIYSREKKEFYRKVLVVLKENRNQNKEYIINTILVLLREVIM